MLCLALPIFMSAQAQPDPAIKRRIIAQIAPAYPSLARNMALEGVVRLEVLVDVDGAVTKVEVKGAHPVLAQAAGHCSAAMAVGKSLARIARNGGTEIQARVTRETVEVPRAIPIPRAD